MRNTPRFVAVATRSIIGDHMAIVIDTIESEPPSVCQCFDMETARIIAAPSTGK